MADECVSEPDHSHSLPDRVTYRRHVWVQPQDGRPPWVMQKCSVAKAFQEGSWETLSIKEGRVSPQNAHYLQPVINSEWKCSLFSCKHPDSLYRGKNYVPFEVLAGKQRNWTIRRRSASTPSTAQHIESAVKKILGTCSLASWAPVEQSAPGVGSSVSSWGDFDFVNETVCFLKRETTGVYME